jgi:hypothetical protein
MLQCMFYYLGLAYDGYYLHCSPALRTGAPIDPINFSYQPHPGFVFCRQRVIGLNDAGCPVITVVLPASAWKTVR